MMLKKIVRNNYVYTRTLLEKFSMDFTSAEYEVDDEIDHWLKCTEKGKWCERNCINIEKVVSDDHLTAHFRVAILGYMTDKDLTFFTLKWG